jgi:hypothetical protein
MLAPLAKEMKKPPNSLKLTAFTNPAKQVMSNPEHATKLRFIVVTFRMRW